MTIKEIAELTGLNRMTISRKIKELYPVLIKKGITTRLTEKESIKVVGELRKKGFIQPAQNDQVDAQNVQPDFMTIINSINSLAAGLMANAQAQNARLEALEGKFQKRVDALPAPQISPRNEISKIVREYANKNDLEFRDVWHTLYDDFNYRMERHFSQTAKRRGLKTIDFIESEGYIGELLAVAREILE